MFFTILSLATATERLRIDLLVSTALVVMLASDDKTNDAAGDKAVEAFKILMQLRLGKRDGWVQFCERIGANPAAMAAPFLEDVDWAMGAAEDIAETLEAEAVAGGNDLGADIAEREREALLDAWGDTS